MAERVLLHVLLEPRDSEFVQVPSKQHKEVGREVQGHHQGAL